MDWARQITSWRAFLFSRRCWSVNRSVAEPSPAAVTECLGERRRARVSELGKRCPDTERQTPARRDAAETMAGADVHACRAVHHIADCGVHGRRTPGGRVLHRAEVGVVSRIDGE